MVGRRVNIFPPFPRMSSDAAENGRRILVASQNKPLFQSDAEDYFLFTRDALDWREIKDVVIGRPGYDNYLVTQVYHRRERVSFVDVTNALVVAHQTDVEGVKAGHRRSRDKVYNLKLIGRDWQKGRTEYSDWRVEQSPARVFSLLRRTTPSGRSFDDGFLVEEVEWVRRWIPSGARCAYFAKRVVSGVLGSLCARVVVVVAGEEVSSASRNATETDKKDLLPNVEVLTAAINLT